jgi:hypothetical protein
MMTEREKELRRLAAEFREHDVVTDAFLAKSFTDHLLIVDVQCGESIPRGIVESLREHDLVGANEVYDDSGTDVSFAGSVGNATRHQFVDVLTRGDHQSYVVE